MSRHVPVLFREALDLLHPVSGGRYLDATFGGGGHSRGILESAPGVRVVAIDRDPAAADRARNLAESFPGQMTFMDMDFRQIATIPEDGFAGALFDLGVSSFQLDEVSRGFSFREDAPNDMRMDPRHGLSAADFLETASRDDLVRAVRDYGEERQWRRVVPAIMNARGTGALRRTVPFAEVVSRAVGPGPFGARGRIHPATRTFQGIRIAINDELMALEEGLNAAFEKLSSDGVLAVISFHSLEDRIVKRFFRRLCGEPEHASDSTPKQLRRSVAQMLTRRPITPGADEIADNPRSRSARLRALRKN